MNNDYEKHLLKKTKAELAKMILRLQDELDIASDLFDQFITYATVMQEDKNYCVEHACGMCKFHHFCKMCKARAWFLYHKEGMPPCDWEPYDECVSECKLTLREVKDICISHESSCLHCKFGYYDSLIKHYVCRLFGNPCDWNFNEVKDVLSTEDDCDKN